MSAEDRAEEAEYQRLERSYEEGAEREYAATERHGINGAQTNLLREAYSYGDVKVGKVGSEKYNEAEGLRKMGLLGKPIIHRLFALDAPTWNDQARFPITQKGRDLVRGGFQEKL